MATVTKPLALNESLNTTEQTPRNVADVLSDGLENIKQAIEGGGSGGHTIQNSAGTDLPQEDKMQFVGLSVSDDSENGKTIIEHNINNDTPTFTEATTRANINSGETISTLFGKIKKWFTDLPSMFVSKSDGGTFWGNVTIDKQDGSTTAIGQSELILGNNIVEGTAKNSKGVLQIYGKGAYRGNIGATNLTANRDFELPNKSGTFALTSDIPDEGAKNYTYTQDTNKTILNSRIGEGSKIIVNKINKVLAFNITLFTIDLTGLNDWDYITIFTLPLDVRPLLAEIVVKGFYTNKNFAIRIQNNGEISMQILGDGVAIPTTEGYVFINLCGISTN